MFWLEKAIFNAHAVKSISNEKKNYQIIDNAADDPVGFHLNSWKNIMNPKHSTFNLTPFVVLKPK